MDKCTKTKFNGVLQDDNLPRYNIIKVKRTKDGTGGQGQIVTLVGTGVTVNSSIGSALIDRSQTSTPVTISGTHAVNVEGIGNALYIDKYNKQITLLEVNKAAEISDIEDLRFLTGLTSIQFVENCGGDIKNLSGLTSLATLRLYRTSVYGSIIDLANLVSLTTLTITNAVGVTGSLEEFAESLASAHASGTLSVDVTGSGITYNGSPVSSSKTITFDGAGGYIIN